MSITFSVFLEGGGEILQYIMKFG